MDDKNFDQRTATEWIKIIEDPSASIREKDIYPLIKTWLSHSSSSNVLDIGCGQGVCSSHLGEIQIQYVGLDPSPDLILRAEDLYADASRHFIKGNVYEMPFSDEHFGAVFSIAVWHLLSDISKASTELSRVLKDDGKFLILTADPNRYKMWIDRYEEKNFSGSVFKGRNHNSDGTSTTDTLYLHSMDEIIARLEEAGLSVSKNQTVRSFVALSGFKK